MDVAHYEELNLLKNRMEALNRRKNRVQILGEGLTRR